jgi:FAD/FMN-containing dehydrogenase
VDDPAAAIRLLARAKEEAGGAVEAFELMGRRGVEFVLKNIPDQRDPLAQPHPWYVLIEIASGEPGTADAALERLLAWGLEDGLVRDDEDVDVIAVEEVYAG